MLDGLGFGFGGYGRVFGVLLYTLGFFGVLRFRALGSNPQVSTSILNPTPKA